MTRTSRLPLTIAAVVLAAAGAGVFLALDFGAEPEPSLPPPSLPRAVEITGTTYYVDPQGSDESDGTSVGRAWATVQRANEAELRPGDGILFRGGATFDDEPLEITASGTEESPVVYGSFGRGKAQFRRSVFVRGSRVVVQDLDLREVEQGIASVASSPSGVQAVTIQRNAIRDSGIAIHSAHAGDADWAIRNNVIEGTGDSAMIVVGARAVISQNSIEDAGRDEAIDYGKHGIYLKGAHGTVTGNRIDGFHDGSAVSVRRHDSRVERNEIADGPIGVSWFQQDPGAGTSLWRDNRISGTTRTALYVSPSDAGGDTRENFVITGNVLDPAAGTHLNLSPTAGRYTLRGNSLR